MNERGSHWALGIDVGGTHTDIALVRLDDGRAYRYKLASTPDDPARAVNDGMREMLALSNVAPDRIEYFAHGSTVATNAVVQHRTARAALLTTEGFRDVLEIRRQRQPHVYNLKVAKPAPPIARRDRHEVAERHYLFGRPDEAPDLGTMEALAQRLLADGVEALAVCFLHAYDDASHERAVGAWLRERMPGVFITLSSDVVPEPKEYERTSTTAINACLGPVMNRYLARIATGARACGLLTEPMIMQSNGGVASVNDAVRWPVRALASGPAAGVIGAIEVAREVGIEDLITFDVGGTTADVCLVEGAKALVSAEREIAGYPVCFPMFDVHSVGAGGGSIAQVDGGGFLHVGPDSAGADPGPAAYGRGGRLPTVTDACLLLGQLSPEGLLHGRLPLDVEAAHRALARYVARPLAMSEEDAACGMLTLLNENMVQAVRVISIERGFDPRRFALVAFGGAGPLLAGALAQVLGMARILIPRCPGLLCAQGLLAADQRADFALTNLMTLTREREEDIVESIASLAGRAAAWFDAGQIPQSDRSMAYFVDLRYQGQSHALQVALARDAHDPVAALTAGLSDAHRRAYGFAPDAPAQAVTFRVVASARTHTALDTGDMAESTTPPAQRVRPVRFPGLEAAVECLVVARESLAVGMQLEGPLIVEQMDATTVVPPGAQLNVLAGGVLEIWVTGGM